MKKVIVFILALILSFSFSISSFATDNYTEYFSKEREFVVVDNALDSSTYLYSDKETGYLYSRNIDTKEENLIYKGNVTNHYIYNGQIYCVVNGKTLIKIDIDKKFSQTIFITNKNIDKIYANEDLIFYLANNTIYRYHIESRKTDILVTDDYIHYFYPYSNYVIEFGDGDGEIYRLTSTGELVIKTPIENYSFLEENNSTIITSRAPVNVHGRILPLTEYDDGEYFTQSGNACALLSNGGCHEPGHACSKNLNTCNNCITYNDAAQCFGFAHYVFNKIWGYDVDHSTDRHYHDEDIDSIPSAKNFLWNCPSGTHLRVTGPHTMGHSIIIADVTTSGVYIYHANGHGNCRVDYEYMSFYTFIDNYDHVEFSYYDDNHSFGNSKGYDDYRHWDKCTRTSCNGKTNFEAHTFTTSGNYAVCECGYRIVIAK